MPRLRLALEEHRWGEAATLSSASQVFPWGRFAWAGAITTFARAIGAARSGDVAQARAQVQKLEGFRNTLVAANQTYWAGQVDVQHLAAAAWVARAEGKKDEALTLMHTAADLEDSTEKHPVTPGPVVPARELLGEMLLDLNQPAQALVEFEASARREPSRFNGLFGAARAAELSGTPPRPGCSTRASWRSVTAPTTNGPSCVTPRRRLRKMMGAE